MKNLWIPIVIYLSKKQKKLPPPLSEKKERNCNNQICPFVIWFRMGHLMNWQITSLLCKCYRDKHDWSMFEFISTPRNSSSSFKKLVVLVSNIFSHFDSFFAFFLKMNEDLRPWFIDNHAILILMRFRMFDMLRLCIIICPYSKDKTLLGIVTLLMPMLPKWFFLSIFELIYHVWCIFMLLAIFLNDIHAYWIIMSCFWYYSSLFEYTISCC